ncbi:MAG TPA: diguanylate cyclase [Baekduia sp.]|uniref:diguanylate cyclase domain-containing protein n=1 Tax=Baekduia sp. TaxID=2600305 RepID=UPI002D766F05|nr:diguanylate cyclase [Baekduia sp.]HET6509838.1 diguanylate cyclase [Baekduia sp.]
MGLLPPTPPNEPQRLAALRRLRLLDSEADPAYQSLAELAARLLGTPMAAVSLIDADRQWTKAGVGLRHGDEDPRDVAFCAHAIGHDADPWVVADAAADPDFADNPLVTGGRVGFYAGAPVRTAEGHKIGTLCVIDPTPRELDEAGRETLRALAAAVGAHVEVRRQQLVADERHAELQAILEATPDAFLRLDGDGVVLAMNAAAETLFGWDREVLTGLRVGDTIVPEGLRQAIAAMLHRAGDEGVRHRRLEAPARHRDGRQIPVELTIGATETDGEARFNVFLRDISDRLDRERERREETAALAALADVTSRLARGLDDAVVRDQLCHAACRVGDAAGAVLLVPDDEGALIAAGGTDSALRETRVAPGMRSVVLESYTSGDPMFVGDALAEGWPLAARHDARSIATQPIKLDGRCIGVLVVYWHDVRQLSDRRSRLLVLLAHEASTAFARTALVARLARQSRTDALTGVLNRRALDDELHLALLNARRDDAPVSVAILDLDHFKAYNDTYGHGAGDQLLKGACAAWSGALRAGDVLARFGGEEFVVLLPGCGAADARAMIDRLRAATPSGQTCSAGVAQWDGAEDAGAVVERADRALYRAKDGGRDRVELAA